ncbi:MAG: hypothetical protein ACI4WG_04795 [Erysipelotrichaceae bacterium]
MSYSEVIKISESFKTSINIEYDLLKEEKLSKYIPTSDVCEVMRGYLMSVEDSSFNRASILEGPYGKGKSYLVLSLLQILYMDGENEHLQDFVNKASLVDKNFAEQIKRIKANGVKLIPIVVNSNYTQLNQSLNIALKEALVRVGLEQLFPNTAYEVALNVMAKWESNDDINGKILDECLKERGIKLNKLKKGLANYSYDCYESFIKLYNCINKTGQDFLILFQTTMLLRTTKISLIN